MNDNIGPDPGFLERLEWQLASEVRRRRRSIFASRRRRARSYAARLVTVLMLVSAGYGAAVAARHYRDSSEKRLLVAEADAAIVLAGARVSLLEDFTGDLAKEVAAGTADPTNLAVSRMELSQAGRDLERARLNRLEIEYTGQPARDQLSAPPAGGRDFVSERLRLELEAQDDRLRVIRDSLKQAESDAAAGRSHVGWVESLRQELLLAEKVREPLEFRLELRASYLSGRRTAQEVSALAKLAQARARLEAAKARSAMISSFAESLRKSGGTTSPTEVRLAEFETLAAGVEERLARLEVEHLELQLGGDAPGR